MGKLIMWNMVTLDGFFEGRDPWDIEWHQSAWDQELDQLSLDQLNSAAMLMFGRITYQGMAAYWIKSQDDIAGLMNSLPKIVVSRTLDKAEWQNTRIINENLEQEIKTLKQVSEKDIFIFGSANLIATLMQANLIDEYRIGLCPILIGDGTPLFKNSQTMSKMRLIEAKALKLGVVLLRYEPKTQA